ncbi:MAG: NUDIX hydrolase [Acidimicrobiales bacterium]
MREWLVAGGVLIDANGDVLLVENRRRSGETDWSTPGGVIDEGEQLIEGLTREVAEETGIAVASWSGPLYRIEVTAPGFGFHLRVEAHLAVDYSGLLAVDDPDGIVIGAEFMRVDVARQRLGSAPQWVAEPLLDHLEHGFADGRHYGYRLDGTTAADRLVVRL